METIKNDSYIFEYYQAIKEKRCIVSKWVEAVYEHIVKGIENGDFIFDEDKANHAVDWIEAHCFHTEGALAPGALKLELWQKAFISCVFGVCDATTGKRQFREIVLIVARKNGKTLLAAAIAKYVWYVDGGYGTRVYCIAPKLDQADLVYNSVWQMTQLDPEWQALKEKIDASRDQHNKKQMNADELAKRTQKDLLIAATNSTVKKIAFSAKKSDGFNPSLTICDEIASWEGASGLKQYEVMKSAMGAREMGDNPSILLSCSTSGYINDSIFDEIIQRSTRFLKGDSKEKRLLPFLYMIDDVEKWNDMDELRKSNPNLGVSVSEDYLAEEIAIAEGSLSKKAEFIVKYCNLKQNSSTAWLSTQAVEKASEKQFDIADFRHSYAVGGIDLSQTTDLTSCCLVVEKNGELYVFSHFFMPAGRVDEAQAADGVPYRIFAQQGLLTLSGDNFVDYRDCYNWILNTAKQSELLPLVIGYDRYSAQYLVEDLKAAGFRMDDVYQGYNLTPVIREVDGLIKDGKIHIGNNNLLKAHLLNASLKQDLETQKIKMIKSGTRTRIDGAAALLDAFCVRQKYYAEIGEQLKNTR